MKPICFQVKETNTEKEKLATSLDLSHWLTEGPNRLQIIALFIHKTGFSQPASSIPLCSRSTLYASGGGFLGKVKQFFKPQKDSLPWNKTLQMGLKGKSHKEGWSVITLRRFKK